MTPHELAALIGTVATDVLAAHDLDTSVLPETIVVERPRHADHGDYATTLALQVAKKLGVNPRELAGWLAAGLEDTAAISAAEVAGPGFINLRLDTGSQGKLVGEILAAGTRYGRSETLSGQHINLEFVSANPTGPLHLGGARWAAVGSALGSILASQGAQVTREYYFNDHGAQIDRFARSVDAAAHGLPTPEDGYGGDYIADVAAQVTAAVPGILDLDDATRLETFRAHGVELMFAHVKRTLTEFGTEFDVFFHENSLFESGAVDAVIAKLKDNGNLYFQDGAWWLKSSDFGDDKDRVVIKSDGDAAYIAGDIAYIEDKLARGADRAIYMLGADHHGYIQRLKAAAQALGHDAAVVEVLIGQMVNLVRDGQPVKMSKRAGTIITLDDLVEAVGVDAGRYAMLRNSVDSTLDIDLEKWASRTSDNPVFYVQYGHARLCSIARKAADLGITTTGAEIDFALLSHEREGELIRTLGDYPTVLATAAELREPHRVARYAEDLAGTFHRFYDACQILPKGEETVAELHRSRLALAMATRQVLANALDVIGISAPERM